MTCRRAVSLSVAAGMSLVATLLLASRAPESRAKVRSLVVEQRFLYDSKGSSAVDLRWSGADRLFLLRSEDGVAEVELREGMPILRSLLPGRHQMGKIHPQQNLAVSGDWIASSSPGAQFLWARLPASGSSTEAQIRNVPASVSDFDFDGEEILVLGYALYGDLSGGTYLWQGRLDSANDLESAPGLEKATSMAEIKRRGDLSILGAGSLRVLPNGDRLVFSGFDDEVRVISSSGRQEAHWSLAELGVHGDVNMRPAMDAALRDKSKPQNLMSSWLKATAIVDDVLLVNKTPAVVVRQASLGSQALLVLLESSGIRTFSIPIRSLGSTDRLKADADAKGRIALLTAPRVRDPDSAGKQEVLVVSIPD